MQHSNYQQPTEEQVPLINLQIPVPTLFNQSPENNESAVKDNKVFGVEKI